MANWFCSSVAYAAVAQWAASADYNVDAIVRQLAAPTNGSERCFRCTTAGTSGGAEPAWTLTKAGTTNDNTVAWTEVTGNSAYNTLSSTWAAPFANLRGHLVAASQWPAAGDTIYVRSDHNHVATSVSAWTFPGTNASPNIVQVVDGSGNAATGAVESMGSVSNGGHDVRGALYVAGLTLRSSSADTYQLTAFENSGINKQLWKDCAFEQGGGAVNTALWSVGGAGYGANNIEWSNCQWKPTSTAARIYAGEGTFIWRGGGMAFGSNAVATQMVRDDSDRRSGVMLFDGLDLSLLNAACNLVGSRIGGGIMKFRNCKLPSSWTGGVYNGAPAPALRVEMWNCDSADTNYRMWIEDYCGSIKSETTLVKTGGASDGTTPLSWKMATSANAEYPIHILRSPEIQSEWIESVGSAKTITVDILHDSVTNLKDDEIWLEVQYLGTSGFPLGSFISDAKADILATAADQTTSTATWTTTGMTNPNKQKLAVTFTPQEKGVAIVTVCMAKASYTVYVDPFAQLGSSGTERSFQMPGAGQINTVSAASGGGVPMSRVFTGM